jgi:cytochrome P450
MSLPPGPRLPAPLQSMILFARPVKWVEGCRRRYGDLVTLHDSIIGEMVYVSDPELIQRVFKADPMEFTGGESRGLEVILGRTSLLMLDGKSHLRKRKLLTPAFHGENVKRYVDLMTEVTTREVESWPLDKPFPIARSTQSITLDVIMRAVFGMAPQRHAELRRRLTELVAMPPSLFMGIAFPGLRRDLGRWSPWGRFVRLRGAIDELLYEEIARRRAGGPEEGPGDVLSLLLAVRDEVGNGLTDVELRDELITMLIVGHETTATGLAWTFERLLRNPRVLDRLKQELEAGDETYLEAVMKESLRSRPVAMSVPRKLTEDMELGGYAMPAGTLLLLSIALVHQSPELYPDPQEFRPERFLDGAPDPQAFIPFGGGVRRCIGASFSWAEMKVVISTILKLVELEAPSSAPERTMFRGPVLKPAKGGRVKVTRRLEPVAAAA